MNSRLVRPARSSGFTLIELLIAVIVIGVLGAIAFPSFMDSIRKGRRSEAYSALSAAQQAQERWRSSHANYTATLSDLNVPATTTPGAYYGLSITSADAVSYELKANGSGSSQASDGQCAILGVRVASGEVSYAGCASCTTFTYAATSPCWSK